MSLKVSSLEYTEVEKPSPKKQEINGINLIPFSGLSEEDIHLIETMNLIYNYFQLSQEIPKVYSTQLYEALTDCRQTKTKEEWEETCKSIVVPHPITKLILQDPCTKHSFEKPKGYAGDATLIDYFYKLNKSKDHSELANQLLKMTISRPAGVAVNERAIYIANELDELAETTENAKVLSIACGYLREARLSKAVFRSQFETFIAFDQDKECIDDINSDLSSFGIEGHEGNIVALMKDTYEFGTFDYIYSAGLLDYLSINLSRRLLKYLFNKLNPGGSILVTNFIPNIEDAGYMEAFMQWFLIYKTLPEMDSIASGINPNQLARKELFRDKHNQLIYLKLTKV